MGPHVNSGGAANTLPGVRAAAARVVARLEGPREATEAVAPSRPAVFVQRLPSERVKWNISKLLGAPTSTVPHSRCAAAVEEV